MTKKELLQLINTETNTDLKLFHMNCYLNKYHVLKEEFNDCYYYFFLINKYLYWIRFNYYSPFKYDNINSEKIISDSYIARSKDYEDAEFESVTNDDLIIKLIKQIK